MSLRAIFHRTALSRTSARNFRPRLERLEDRDLLSTLVVTDPGDSGAKTLRGLLASAAAGDTIVFDPAVTSITLTSGALTVAKNLSVKGPAGRVRVARSSASGTPEFSVVLVNSGVTATLSGLTITGGFTLLGGGIDNVGTLTLDDVFVSANSGHSNFVSGVRTIGKGAGLYNAGNVTITNSSIDNNVGLSASDPANPTDPGGDAPFFGGGLYNAGGIVIVNLSYVTNNRISGSGGGFYNSGGTVAVFDSTLAGNIAQVPRAITSNGGVAWNASGTFVLTSDTLWSNAAEVGGALGNLGNMALVNCTLVNNALLAPVLTTGIIDNTGTLSVASTTLWGGSDPGIHHAAGTLTLRNSILTSVNGAVSAASPNNFISTINGTLTGIGNGTNGNQIGTAAAPIDPKLGPLANNGGPTLTMAPLRGSPVIDAGSNTELPSADQRGSRRVFGGVIDIGAVEATFPEQSFIGVFDPGSANWYLRGSNSAGPPALGPFAYGGRGWIPVAGDWDGDGLTGIGVVDPGSSVWYLRNSANAGAPDVANPFGYGAPGWVPVAGDWSGTGQTGIGMFDPSTGTWYLRNEDNAGAPDAGVFQFGGAGWIPVVGDWTGSGKTTIGVIDPGTMTWYLRNSNNSGAPDFTPIQYGVPGWKPIVGDWDNNGTTTIGVVDPNGVWYLRNSNSNGSPDLSPFPYGLGTWTPLAGHWLATGPGGSPRSATNVLGLQEVVNGLQGTLNGTTPTPVPATSTTATPAPAAATGTVDASSTSASTSPTTSRSLSGEPALSIAARRGTRIEALDQLFAGI